MGIVSGIGGAVDGQDTVREWSINYEGDLQQYAASNTQGGHGATDGVTDWNGQYSAYGHTPARFPGESFTFTGDTSGGNGASGTARCDQIELVWDIEGGGIISHVTSFSANGALTLGAAAAADAVVPDPPSAIGTKAAVATPAASPSFTDLTNVREMRLTISADNPAYSSSDTSGQMRREAGNINFSGSISRYEDDPSAFIAPNTTRQVRLYVDATTYWDLKWAKFGEVSDLLVNMETGEIVGGTENFVMDGFETISATPTVGAIINPATTTKWP